MVIQDIKDPKRTKFAYEGAPIPRATRRMMYLWHWYVLDLTKYNGGRM